ncbi:MAG: flavin reductase [candidate division KSB1 bacterium]|nr:flavin reductase [candidate division KSB1 bacterium]MDZ7345615.1 flavin reductase [candidate division KSB1 bacterium]
MQWDWIDLRNLDFNAFEIWQGQGLLLASGDYAQRHYNAMTIGWGAFGILWGKPAAFVFVRPTRFTFQFMEQYPTFSISAFSKDYASALHIMGTRSGRDGDKFAAASLTVIPSGRIAAPSFAEAEWTAECRTIFRQDIEPKGFLDKEIEAFYPRQDYHRLYVGEILGLRRRVD